MTQKLGIGGGDKGDKGSRQTEPWVMKESRGLGVEGGGAEARMLSQEADSTERGSKPNLEDCVSRGEEPSTERKRRSS